MRTFIFIAGVILVLVSGASPLWAQQPVNNKPDPSKTQAPAGRLQPLDLPPAYDPSVPVNYVRVKVAVAPVSSERAFDAAGYAQVKQTTQYLDGLGRTLQTVSRQATPGADPKDVVAPVVYNEYGQEEYKFLPYTAAGSQGSNGAFKTDPFNDQNRFYKNEYKDAAGMPVYPGEQFFYSQAQTEPSPLNRLTMALATGNSWVGSGRGVAQAYLTNINADQVIRWNFSNQPLATNNGPVTDIPFCNGGADLYEEGTLYKNATKDEQGNAVVEYTNKQGQVILKKVQAGEVAADYSGYEGWLCTFYIYDDFSRLRFVIPPKAVEWLQAHNWDFINSDEASRVLAELCFRYEFDARQRMIAKKVPGADWVYMIYDLRDRLVLTQDAYLRKRNQWNAIVYDFLNRPVVTGLYDCDLDRDELRERVGSSANDLTTISSLWNYELIPMVVTHLDNYKWIDKRFHDRYNSILDASANPYPDDLPALASQQKVVTTGLVTGMDVRIITPEDLPAGTWLSSYNFYDAKGRLIQMQGDNYAGGTDVSTNRYDFTGKLICNYVVHTNPQATGAELRIKTNFDYDHTGRLLNTWKTINGQENKRTLTVKNDYDETGRLKSKELGRKRRDDGTYDPAAPLEKLDYNYNIRGWLRGINAAYSHPELNAGNTPDRWFGMELNYDWGSTETSNNQYSGNISSINWRSRGDGVQRAYGYSYDQANRLLGADFSERQGNAYADNPRIMFDVLLGDNTHAAGAYDAAGNILSMTQWGLKPGGSLPIDKLTYTYFNNSNKLKAVTEDAANAADNKLGDFTDNNTGAEDYGYDLNGNLISDLNKHIEGPTGIDREEAGAIEYNHLNLPWKITVNDKSNANAIKGIITYTYDGTGNKLEKKVLEYPTTANGYHQKEIITTYLGAFVYEKTNDDLPRLQFVSHEEGRMRLKEVNAQVDCSFDYFVKDHLGNVRMVLTDETTVDPYPVLSFDGDNRQLTEQQQTWDDQNSQPLQVSTVRTPRPGNFGDEDTNGSYAMLVRKSTGAVGAARLLKVMSGDRIHTSVEYYYTAADADNSVANSLGSLITSVAGVLSAGSQVADALKGQGGTVTGSWLADGDLASMLNNPVSRQGNRQAPKAYLNILFFDEQFVLDKAHSLVIPIAYQPNQRGIIDRRLSNAVETPKNGYAYIYFSNESNEMVYFDNFMLTHERGPLLEETHYYPFGLAMAGISSKAAGGVENRFKYNDGTELASKEFNDGSGLELYETSFRSYDPQLGRFWQIDPLSEIAEDWSPYVYAYDNPLLFNDPFGLTSDTTTVPEMEPVIVTPGNNRSGGPGLAALPYQVPNVADGMPAILIDEPSLRPIPGGKFPVNLPDPTPSEIPLPSPFTIVIPLTLTTIFSLWPMGGPDFPNGNEMFYHQHPEFLNPDLTPSGRNKDVRKLFLVRFGDGPESKELLGSQAQSAEIFIGFYGVSTRLRSRSGNDGKYALLVDVMKRFQIKKTGKPDHFTVILPKPVTDKVAEDFNSLFIRK